MSKDKKSILEEAATDLIEIVEAAKKVAKDNLANELPEKFDMLLNEELEKVSSKESVNESVKDRNKKEPVKGKKTGKKKESINEELDMSNFSLGEVENAFDQAGDSEEFAVVPDEETQDEVTVDSIAQAINSIGDTVTQKEVAEAESVSDPYSKFKELAEQMGQMVKEMEDTKMHEEYGTQFDSQMTELYGEGYAQTLGEEKCGQLKEMFIAHKKGEPFGDNSHQSPNVNESSTEPFIEKGKTLSEDEDQPYDKKSDPSTEQGKSIDEMHDKVPRGATAPADKGHNTTPAGINEKDEKIEVEIEDDKVEVEVGGEDDKEEEREEKPVDEIHGQSYSSGKVRAGTLPNDGAGYRDRPGHSRNRPQWSNETYEKRMKSLIQENKKLTKENNVAKKSFAKAENLVENYKKHLEKYRTQLREMAVFNTNLSNVNNLFVNEELALTKNDKISIVNKFKSINSLDESDKVYGEILTEMKQGKKTITEDVEKKVITSVGESSKKKIDEAIERTAYADNEHVKKIKKLMNYVDTCRK